MRWSPGPGPAGVDEGDIGQAQGSSDAHAAVHIEPLGPAEVGYGLAHGAGDGLPDAMVAGTVVQGEGGAAAGDACGLAEGTPGEAAISVADHLAVGVVAVAAAVAVDRAQRMGAGTVGAVAVVVAGAVGTGPGAVAGGTVAAGIVAVALGEGAAATERGGGAGEAVQRIVARGLGAAVHLILTPREVAEPVPVGHQVHEGSGVGRPGFGAERQPRGLVVAAGEDHGRGARGAPAFIDQGRMTPGVHGGTLA